MKVLVTGAKGFVGRNLVADLSRNEEIQIFEFDLDTPREKLELWAKEADFVFHLAGVNRPENTEDFMEGNFGFTSELLALLIKHKNQAPVMLSSSIQALRDNLYGKSKKAGEDLLFQYSKEYNVPVYIYRFSNLFGKWSKPNYNTVVATFCHNIARDIEIQVNDPKAEIELCYIDDVIAELKLLIEGKGHKDDNFYYVPTVHKILIGELAELIQSFKESRKNLLIPDMKDEFSKKLYATYLSFLPENDFSYELKMNVDHRGSFTEFLKSDERGQVSINVAKPGIIKGQHWHHTKNEKFLVVSGEGVIRFRKVGEDKVIEYPVSGEKLEVVDIPTGYTHNIENTGKTDMVTVMWANEVFDPNNPDTFYEEV
ncbi:MULTISPECIES: capsular polysaccharide biosynthesis protein CapF [unclassified Facklamia]|uniref:capsular polysaccharide biosynthesis protein CapF n=1 Tax=Aerococcaceae TaxID=186827 RepID=UPI0013B917F7|nr:capsular polysaccharide biosynthesis protein CapF [Aerococcaceae bacterium zg-B36]NEW65059.1 NAD-dependent epimerase/dehydratase family protein [Facklamia sp. 252]NEW68716.1 NAD-dependent epimerase/dehydratase family protein [Facklamia sp. 253]QQD65123.1 capsular polysaccharide biosynthesis protein CapF [Aerococcaceae bacterium zg-252]